MKSIAALITGACALSVGWADYVAPTFTIDLDTTAPKDRWGPMVKQIVKTHGWNATYGSVVEYMQSMIPIPLPIANDLLDGVLDDLGSTFGEEYWEEIQGVAAALQEVKPAGAMNITEGDVVLLNIIYDLTAFCTSIVAQTPVTASDKGIMWHGRNLDYGIPGINLMTAEVEFQTGGQTAYIGTAFVGYVGLLTGMRPGGWSVSIDQRSIEGASGLTEMWDNILSWLEGGHDVGMFLRSSLASTETASFDTAVTVLNDTRLVAPCYLIVGGVEGGQGCVITRDRPHSDTSHGVDRGVWCLNSTQVDGWYRVETNSDNWDAPSDDGHGSGTPRRIIAEEGMNAMGSAALDSTSLMKVLSTPPVLNPNTEYTTIMSPATGYYHVVVREQDP